MRISTSMRWLVVVAGAIMLLSVAAACSSETVEVPGETVVVEKEVVKTVEVPGETVTVEVVKEVQVPGETVVVEKVVTETVEVPGETVVVEKEVVKTVEVPGETVTVEVVKEVMVPGQTVVVEKEVVKTVEVPGETVVVEKEVVKTVEVPGETVVVEKEVVKTVEVPGETVVVEKEVVKTVEVAGPERVMVKEVRAGYVTDPTTGKAVSAPQYGGTITYPYFFVGETTDPLKSWANAGYQIAQVNERLAWGDWGIDREVYDFRDSYVPDFAITGSLAESWETPDPLTYIFHIRPGVHYALDQDSEASRLVNGRELTADDVVYNWQRNNALGDFTEPPQIAPRAFDLPWESIEATDKYTVVMKMTEPSLIALRTILIDAMQWILPPEVIEKYGNYEDWKNVVGTGPLILTEYAEGVSITWEKNPDYWRYDEKYPENRLPYVDQMRALDMPEEATRLAALRTGKVDIIISQGTSIQSLDVVRSLQRTNPDIEVSSNFLRSGATFSVNIRKPPFDDIRVRHAMQMALDLETINNTYYGGFARWEPMGGIASKPYGTTFEDYPEDLKQYFAYDPEGAEKLLDEAGYPRGADGVRFKVDLDHRDVYDLGYREIAVGYWEEIGVDVKIEIYDTQGWAFDRRGVGERTEDVPQEDLLRWDMSDGDGGMYSDPDVWVANYRQTLQLWRDNVGGVETPELTAVYDAFYAATTEEEQLRVFKEWDMLIIRQHNQIWGPMAPLYLANQPWVIGYSGEMRLHEFGERDVLARLWIDQGLKKAMGR